MIIEEIEVQEFLKEALISQGITKLTPIQEKSINKILSKTNVVMKAKTGSGKTLAFLVPAINSIDLLDKNPQILIVAPTRELALQITEEARKLTRKVEGYKVAPLVGATSFQRQVDNIKNGAKIVVGTPGRLLDHIERKSLKLKSIKTFILDEADEMLDMGFRDDITKIYQAIKTENQKILCSATFDKEVKSLIDTIVKDHDFIDVEENYENKSVEQQYVYIHQDKKMDALLEIIKDYKNLKCIIFCNTKKMVDVLNDELAKRNYNSISIHSDKRQGDRKKAIDSIKKGSVNILIATDVAARGLDIKNVDYVINYDIPSTSKSYTHRIGRSGRAGESGKAITLVNKKPQISQLKQIINDTDNHVSEKIISITRNDKSFNGKSKDFSKKGKTNELKKSHSSNKDISKWNNYKVNNKEKPKTRKSIKEFKVKQSKETGYKGRKDNKKTGNSNFSKKPREFSQNRKGNKNK